MTLLQIEWLSPRTEKIPGFACPNCGDKSLKLPVLRTPCSTRRNDPVAATLMRCTICGAGFFDCSTEADYFNQPAGGGAALAFYVQQGAGLWGMAHNLIDLNRPRGTHLLELGCGFGFGLHFAQQALGWTAEGYDPSPFATAGRDALNVRIHNEYASAGDPRMLGQFDVVMASEILEHVTDPLSLAGIMFAALRPGGTLLLTTPDVEEAQPKACHGMLAPLLSIGFHLVIQSAASLQHLLRRAGFTQVQISRSSPGQLIARAQKGASAPPAPSRIPQNLYSDYLSTSLQASSPATNLWLGFATRLYRFYVNNADLERADILWRDIEQTCQQRFGFSLNDAAPVVANPTLEQLAEAEPLCLGPLLLHRGWHLLASGVSRGRAEPVFHAAAAACDRLRMALQLIGSDDADAENVAWVATSETLICAAERGAPGVPARLARLAAPHHVIEAGNTSQNASTSRLMSVKRSIFVSLVNSGCLEDAGELVDVLLGIEEKAKSSDVLGTVLEDSELDALFCGATLELQRTGGDVARALDLLHTVRGACDAAARARGAHGSPSTLLEPTRAAEILALQVLGRIEQAAAVDAPGRAPAPAIAKHEV